MQIKMSRLISDKLEQRIRFVTRFYAPDRFDADRAWADFTRERMVFRPKKRFDPLIAVAASLLLLLGSGSWLLNAYVWHDWHSYQAARGTNLLVWLPDSTAITLSPGATIRFDRKGYGRDSRPVELTGKALFDVRRNPQAPFSVAAGIARVTVLGTCFQVDDRPAGVSVDVISGKVRFEIPREQEEAVLGAGMSGVYSAKTNALVVTHEETRNRIAWKTNRLYFADTPLEEVIEVLEAHYHCRIRQRNGVNSLTTDEASLKLTATLDNLPLRETLAIINQTLGIRLRAE